MIQNAKVKKLIIQGKNSRTDSGISLIRICDELGLKKLKQELNQIESYDITN